MGGRGGRLTLTGGHRTACGLPTTPGRHPRRRLPQAARKAGLSSALVDQQRGSGLGAITLTGWAAVAAVASLAVVLVAGSGFAAWRWLGRRRQQHRYAPVMKPADA